MCLRPIPPARHLPDIATLIPLPPAVSDDREPRLLVHEGVPYCVLTTSAGELCAYVAVCSHKDRALVPLRLKKGKLACPHHGATFDPSTGDVIDTRGYDLPEGLPKVAIVTADDGTHSLRVRKRHRHLLKKKERKRVAKATAKATA